MDTPHPPWIRHADGVTTVDAEYVRPGFASVHVLERAGRVALVDTGTNASVPLVLRALADLGLAPGAVDFVFLTHVHLDHAGAIGALVERLPRARVLVHPRGARHLVDPSVLERAAVAVYGEETFRKLYGTLVAVPAERVQTTTDGERLRLGSSELVVLHTPGHALHHQVLFDPAARAAFTGDTFGLSYRELDTPAGAFIVPTTTPTQFDPEQLADSVQRVAELGPDSIYLTHFGRVTESARLATALREQIARFAAIAREHATGEQRRQRIQSALRDYLVQRAEAHGITNPATTIDTVLGPDLELNAQGLVAWLDRARVR